MLKSRSALESYRAFPGSDSADGRRALVLSERGSTDLIQLGVYPGGTKSVAAAVLPILGEPLPDSAVLAAVTGGRLIMRIAPDQYWVAGGDSALTAQLQSAISVEAGCITSLNGARTRLVIEGHAARTALARLVSIDLHPLAFPLHGFAQTGIHHVGGLLLRAGEERYEFFALRTYVASLWEVLLDAARPFGYENSLSESLK